MITCSRNYRGGRHRPTTDWPRSGGVKFLGLSSENAAHRIAVRWQPEGAEKEGVFIPRRDTGYAMNHLAGGRLFWRVEPLQVEEIYSTYFSDQARFPKGSVEFDCALVMRNVGHEWHGAEDLYV